ncbi:sigma-70 family RNA polymerase sigma factor [Marinicella sp. W31]|uniref:sigma-70 family RNA polymerase sigma factor n=1 Tax=Marinicella sp. W31 TaxID=3023713 RepID=UPI0037567130
MSHINELVSTHFYERMLAFVLKKINVLEDAEEVAQDIMLKLVQYQDMASVENVVAWTYRVANNRVIDYYRQKSKRLDVPLPEYLAEEKIADRLQVSECLQPVIKRLPEADRALIEAIDISGQAQKDYAEIHGIAYSTLKSQVQRARVRLRGALLDCCRFDFDENGFPTVCYGHKR